MIQATDTYNKNTSYKNTLKGLQLSNIDSIPIADTFIRMFGDALSRMFPDFSRRLEFRLLRPESNDYRDIMVRLGDRIFISPEECGRLGLSDPEMLAVMAHELGHILYRTSPFDIDSESRADTLAAELGLGHQMIAAIERIISSRRFRHLTSQLVSRIQFLQHIA